MVGDFVEAEGRAVVGGLERFCVGDLLLPVEEGERRAWRDEVRWLQVALREVVAARAEAAGWGLAMEYELPRERGRRPDVVILAGETVLVLEFKQHGEPMQAHVDQAAAYARDIGHYQAASHELAVVPVLVLTGARGLEGEFDGVRLAAPDTLAAVLLELAPVGGGQIDLDEWLRADYAPLPSLVNAARSIFEHDPLPYIRRAQSAGIPETIAALVRAADEAQATGGHHLALVTGVPGSGKTLVGLQFVYHSHFDRGDGERMGVFLSGNGPLVQVLQHALKATVFVQDVHAFLKQYGGTNGRRPQEQIIVFDEAQRAWDARQVGEKRGHATSEPEDFLGIAARHPWSFVVGLIGEGQEIHIGEEAGLGQWNEAVGANGRDWTVHCPQPVAGLFTNAAAVDVDDSLNLTISLRTHLAEDVQAWVEHLLAGRLAPAAAVAERIHAQGFEMYGTRKLEVAEAYVRERYWGEVDKRYGLVASSKAKDLPAHGVNNGFQYTRRVRVGPWYNDPPSSPKSCCQLREVVTEFSCQGLELDFPIVCWGDDLWWAGDHWASKPQQRSKARDPHQLRVNSYRVLLTRGRDGFVVFVPPGGGGNGTVRALKEAGVRGLE